LKRLADQTLYEILEVPPDASSAAIAAAVDRAQALYGPGSLATYTLMSSEEAEQLALRIEDARATLLDPAARRRYDDELARGREVRVASSAPSGTPAPWPAVLPPVIPARARPADADGEGDDDEDDEADEAPAARAHALEPAPPAQTPRPDAVIAPRPILLSREVGAPTPAPVAPAVPPVATPAPAAPGATPPPSSSAAPSPSTPSPQPTSIPVPAPAAAPTAPAATSVPAATPVPLAPAATPVPMIPAPPVIPAGSQVAEASSWSGEVLRQLREARGITVQQLSERTKVTRHHIENIEADRYAALPAAVYLRGILLSLARELRLDGQKVARSYLERFAAGTAAGAPKGR
jgi:hypothetical protein